MLGLWWELRQQRMIGDAHRTAESGRSQTHRLETQVRLTEDRLEKLALICTALWSLLKEKAALTEEQLMERVKEIDLADGVEDGKVTRRVAKCEKCGRVMAIRHSRCLYCGADRLIATPFESVL